ncbi:MAG: aldehyde dehydrogenase family protein [Longimicrobiales bacterium]
MTDLALPKQIPNWIDGKPTWAEAGERFTKVDPATGRDLAEVCRSRAADVELAVAVARRAYPAWRALTPVARGDHVREIALGIQRRADDFATIVHRETGKSRKDALGEVKAAVEMGFFVAGEGRRWYGRTTTSAIPNKHAMVVRQPLGVAGLIIAANTPIANVAWKVFPAIMCGNTAILKASEDTPGTAWAVAKLAHEVGLPPGVFNVVHGFGEEAGAPLVASEQVEVVSFTGSTVVGREIARVGGARLAKVCLELGGKNPLVVCEDADLDRAAESAILSAFSNAGQRCASASRVIVFDAVYDRFRAKLVERVGRIRVGAEDSDDFGPVINLGQLESMLAAVSAARAAGAKILTGGERITDGAHRDGFYMAPTIIEETSPDQPLSRTELFGPITAMYRVRGFEEALALANASPYGLTAAIWTADVHRAMEFINRVESGVAVVNGGTYGSEPHMPFGGLKQSGNGMREAGTEAMDVYSDWKTVYINHDPSVT